MRVRFRILIFAVLGGLAPAADVASFPRLQWFRQHFGSASPVAAPAAEALDEYMVDGKLELRLRDYLRLVLRNNTDISLAKIKMTLPSNALTRSMSAFDPSLQASYNNSHTSTPSTATAITPARLKLSSHAVQFSYVQTFASGTVVNATANTQRSSDNYSGSAYINPLFTTSIGVQIAQPLVRNSGGLETRLEILVARARVDIGRSQFRSEINDLLAAAESLYWGAVEARENVALQEKLVNLRKEAVARAQKQVAAGALLPLEVHQASSQCALAEVSAAHARQSFERAEASLRQQIGADLRPDMCNIHFNLTEPVDVELFRIPDRDSLIAEALRSRPERLSAVQSLHADDLSVRKARDSLRPSVSLTASYELQGAGGKLPNSRYAEPSSPDGLGGTLSQMFRLGFPSYSAGIQLTLPIRGREAAADLADARLRQTQDLLLLRKVEQSVRLQVTNAIEDVAAAEIGIARARVAREFAQKRFEAEQKKYELGVTQLFFVLDAQTQLNQADSSLLEESVNYRRCLLNLLLATGKLPEERGLVLN